MAFCLTDLGISHNFMLSPICCFIAAVLWYGILFLEFQTSPSTLPEFWMKMCSGFFPIICSLSKRHMILKPWSHECMALSLHVCVYSTDTAVVNAMCSKSALSSCLSDSLTCAFKNRLKMEWTNILIWLPLGSLTASSPPLCPFTFTCYKHELIFQYPSAIFIQTLSFYFHFYSVFPLYSLFISMSPSSCLHHRVALLTVSLRCSFVYMYLDRDKSQPCWNAWAADMLSIVQLLRWAFRATVSLAQKRMHTLMKTTALFAPTSSSPWGKWKLRGEKANLCNLTLPRVSQITKGSEWYSKFLCSGGYRSVCSAHSGQAIHFFKKMLQCIAFSV